MSVIDENGEIAIAVGEELGVSATDTLCMGRIRQCVIAVGHPVGAIDTEVPSHGGPKFAVRPKSPSVNHTLYQV
jgi:hypothetical protein